MEWYLVLLVFFGALLLLMLTGMPVAWAFIIVSGVSMAILWHGRVGLEQCIGSMVISLNNMLFLPLVMFILMGEVMFQSGIAYNMIDAVERWAGRIPGRLGLVAVAAGTLLGTLTGASIASAAILGSTLVPEMERRGYKRPMSLGPALGSAGLAIMIPPSGLAVLLAVIGDISIGKLLIGIIIPGLLMATLYGTYIVVRSWLQPSVAPAYEAPATPLREKLRATALYILPLGIVIFLVTGVIFLGIATPSEAGATGAAGCFILAAYYKKLHWAVVKKIFALTVSVSGMVFLLIATSIGFSQILAFSGATQGLVAYILSLNLPPVYVLIGIVIMVIFLGMFLSMTAIIMIAGPIVAPVLRTVGIDMVWAGAIIMLALEMGATSPPFGLALYVMKGAVPFKTTVMECGRAALPFLGCDSIVIALLVAFPVLTLWLPNLMRPMG